eukprot:9046505-Ditylum_brightwellii.AAC.1
MEDKRGRSKSGEGKTRERKAGTSKARAEKGGKARERNTSPSKMKRKGEKSLLTTAMEARILEASGKTVKWKAAQSMENKVIDTKPKREKFKEEEQMLGKGYRDVACRHKKRITRKIKRKRKEAPGKGQIN